MHEPHDRTHDDTSAPEDAASPSAALDGTGPGAPQDGAGTEAAPSAPGPLDRLKALAERAQRSRPARALARYGTARGALLAGGIAYTGLFSVFAALAIGISVLMAVLGSHPELRDAVVSAVSEMLPGVIRTEDGGSGLVSIDQLTLSSAVNLGSVIAALTLLYTAMGLIGTLKTALRAMFGIVQIPQNPVLNQVWNLLGFLVIMVGVVVTAVASVLTGTLAGAVDWLPGWLTGPGMRLLSLAGSFVIDAGVLALVIFVCGIRPPRRDMLIGCAIGAVAFGALREVGTGAVGSFSDNPLLASFAAILVLIVWLHLASRVVLLVGAWMANPPRPRPIAHPAEVHATERPNYVTLSVPETLAWPRQSLTGNLEVDPTANLDYVAPEPVPVPVSLDDELPPRRGLRARLLRWRYARAVARAHRIRDEYTGA